MKKRILAIDDESAILDVMKVIFEEMDCEVSTFTDPVAGLAEGLNGQYDLVLVDVRIPGKNGAEVTEALLKGRPETKVLVITAYPDDPLAARALRAGAMGLLRKPFEIAGVLDFIKD